MGRAGKCTGEVVWPRNHGMPGLGFGGKVIRVQLWVGSLKEKFGEGLGLQRSSQSLSIAHKWALKMIDGPYGLADSLHNYTNGHSRPSDGFKICSPIEFFMFRHPVLTADSSVPIIPADPIVAPEEGTVSVISPTGVIDLVDYSSSSDSDPSKDSLPPDIPIGRLYRTHPGGPCKALTVRKSVRPLSSHRLSLRYTSHHLNHFTYGSSSHSSSDHSSSGHSISGHSLSRHTPPDTTDADSSTP
ncbi:hypothetical protein Tco_0475195 [Tanacetum coccineum]